MQTYANERVAGRVRELIFSQSSQKKMIKPGKETECEREIIKEDNK